MAKFEIYKDKRGEFRFRLKASNGQSILASEGYAAKSGCTNGIESVRKNSTDYSKMVRCKAREIMRNEAYFFVRRSDE